MKSEESEESVLDVLISLLEHLRLCLAMKYVRTNVFIRQRQDYAVGDDIILVNQIINSLYLCSCPPLIFIILANTSSVMKSADNHIRKTVLWANM